MKLLDTIQPLSARLENRRNSLQQK